MIGLDTNVMVRYIMQDDAKQSAQAARLLDALSVDKPGFVTLVSVVELVWVMSSCYDLSRSQLVNALESLLRTKELVIENAEVVWRAVRLFRDSSGDFVDCLVERSAAAAGCFQTMTFDRGAVKNCGMVLVP